MVRRMTLSLTSDIVEKHDGLVRILVRDKVLAAGSRHGNLFDSGECSGDLTLVGQVSRWNGTRH
jgi:hypothetical protein